MPDVENYFERLGLPRRFPISETDLEASYLENARAAHPDHAAGIGLSDSAASEFSSRINEAYRTLRDPWKRADHLLALEGGPTASEQKSLPPEFLEEMLDLRMEVAGLADEADDSPSKQQMGANLKAKRQALFDEAAKGFEELATATYRTASLKALRDTLNRWKYVEGLIRDLDL